MQMTDEELKIRVAELAGWTYCTQGREWPSSGLNPKTGLYGPIPDFATDLNVLNTLWGESDLIVKERWMDALEVTCNLSYEQDCGLENPEALAWATARQKAKAYVIAMEKMERDFK